MLGVGSGSARRGFSRASPVTAASPCRAPRRRRAGTAGEGTAPVVAAAAAFVWGAGAARLQRADLTAPIVFTLVGAALAGFGLVHASVAPETLKPLVEVTLVWVLFSDAARVRVHELRGDLGLVLRLL